MKNNKSSMLENTIVLSKSINAAILAANEIFDIQESSNFGTSLERWAKIGKQVTSVKDEHRISNFTETIKLVGKEYKLSSWKDFSTYIYEIGKINFPYSQQNRYQVVHSFLKPLRELKKLSIEKKDKQYTAKALELQFWMTELRFSNLDNVKNFCSGMKAANTESKKQAVKDAKLLSKETGTVHEPKIVIPTIDNHIETRYLSENIKDNTKAKTQKRVTNKYFNGKEEIKISYIETSYVNRDASEIKLMNFLLERHGIAALSTLNTKKCIKGMLSATEQIEKANAIATAQVDNMLTTQDKREQKERNKLAGIAKGKLTRKANKLKANKLAEQQAKKDMQTA